MDKRPLPSKRGRNADIGFRRSFLGHVIDRARSVILWFGLAETEAIEMEYRWLSRMWRDTDPD